MRGAGKRDRRKMIEQRVAHKEAQKRKRSTTRNDNEGGEVKRPKLTPTLPKGMQPYGKRRATPPDGGPAKRSVAVQADEAHHTPVATYQNSELPTVQTVDRLAEPTVMTAVEQHNQSA